MTANAFLAQLQDALAGKPDKVPAGWKTCEHWAKEWGFLIGKVERLMVAGMKAGVVERKKFRVKTSNVIRPVWHYRQKSP